MIVAVKWYLIVSFICISLMTSDGEHHFTYFLLWRTIYPLFKLVGFVVIVVVVVLYEFVIYADYKSLKIHMFSKYFLTYCVLLVQSFGCVLLWPEGLFYFILFYFNEVYFMCLFLVDFIFVVIVKSNVIKLSPIFYLIFLLLAHDFRSLICFVYLYVQGKGTNIFFECGYLLFSHLMS